MSDILRIQQIIAVNSGDSLTLNAADSTGGFGPAANGGSVIVRGGAGNGSGIGGSVSLYVGSQGFGAFGSATLNFFTQADESNGWQMYSDGSFLPIMDNVSTIGGNGANRPSYGYFSSQVSVGPNGQTNQAFVGQGSSNSSTSPIQNLLINSSSTAEDGSLFVGYRFHGGDLGNLEAVVDTEVLVELQGAGGIDTSFNVKPGSGIRMRAEQNWSSGNTGAGITFYTTLNGTATQTETLHLANNGDLYLLAGNFISSVDPFSSFPTVGNIETRATVRAGILSLDVQDYADNSLSGYMLAGDNGGTPLTSFAVIGGSTNAFSFTYSALSFMAPDVSFWRGFMCGTDATGTLNPGDVVFGEIGGSQSNIRLNVGGGLDILTNAGADAFLMSSTGLSWVEQASSNKYRLDPSELNAGNSGSALTIDLSASSSQLITMTAACTFTLSNPVIGATYLLRLLQDGTGGWAVTWPASIRWAGNTAPTFDTAANHENLVTLYWTGTTYRASASTGYVP